MIRSAILFIAVFAVSTTAVARNTGARHARDDDFDAVVMVEGKTGGRIDHCTGVALSPRVILTAAHCVDPYTVGRLRVAADMREYDQSSDRFVRVEWRDVHSFPEFEYTAFRDTEWVKKDLAIITLPRALEGLPRTFVQVAESLPSASEIYQGESIGYGGRCGGEACAPIPRGLSGRELDERIRERERKIENEKFWRGFQFLNYIPGGVLTFADPLVVPGDSGGPIYLRTRQGLILVALTSTYEGNGASRKVHGVSLTDHLQWIRSVAGDLL